MIGLTHAFCHAVVVKRGGSQPIGLQRGVDEDDSESESQVHNRLGLCLVQRLHRGVDVLSRLRDGGLRDDPNTLAPACTSQVLQVALANEALLDQNTDLGEPSFRDEVRDEDRLVGHRSLREGERPLAQPVVGAGHADGRHLEPFLDGFAQRHAVIGDVGAEDHEAALVDQFAIRVDHRFDRTLGQTLHLAIDHLHGTVHQALLHRLLEYQIESLSEGGEKLLGEPRRELEVHQIADLDRLSSAFVGHRTSTRTR